ncbi:MAG: hypothetical protein ACOC1P_05090 [Minisyncoccales bacterium]
MAININISIEKRHLIIFSCLIAIFGIVLMTNALDTSQPYHPVGQVDFSDGEANDDLDLAGKSLDNYGNDFATESWVNNQDYATESWVSSQNYATEDYVDENAGTPDRSWHDVKGSRNKDTTYTNTHSYPIELAVTSSYGGSAYTNYCKLKYVIDGKTIIDQQNNNPSYVKKCSATVTVPSGSTYKIIVDGYKTGEIDTWHELY